MPALEAWTDWASSRTRRIGAGVLVALLGGVGSFPQFGGPGYEAALSAGLVLPSTAAVIAALEVDRRRPSATEAFARGMAIGLGLAVLGVVVVLLHGLRVGFCDPTEGLVLYALGPAPGAALGGAWGAAVAVAGSAVAPRRGRGALLVAAALAGPFAGMAVSIARFMASPMVFAFDPFFGVLAGPLYDTVVNVVDRLASYRLGTAATLGSLALAANFLDRARGQGARSAFAEGPGTAIVALALGGVSIAHSLSGPRFGHWNSASSIEAALGARSTGKRCDVIHSRGVPKRDIVRFTRDCDRTVPEIEAFFGTAGPPRVRVYLFASAAEKGYLMGAEHTQIAKPWRAEIYLQAAPFPHPVLAHELAHVVAGAFARGPFRVAGPLGGLIPDPGRIEGYAVAAAPDSDDELTSEDWAAAMLKLGVLPELHQLFQLDFLGVSASKAYTVAGAFISYLRGRYGAVVLRRWYAGEALPRLTGGKGLGELDQEFRAALKARVVPERALATARARFERPAIFARSCPRIVDRALAEGTSLLGSGDVEGAATCYRDALRLDPGNVDARLGLAGAALRTGQPDRSIELYRAIAAGSDTPRPVVVRALETSGDIDLARGNAAAARARYAEALRLVFDADRERTLEVKTFAAGTAGQQAVATLLVGDPELGPSWDVAAPLIQAWASAEPTSDLPPYLLGRNIANAGRYTEAAVYLDRALSLPPSLPSVRRETRRLRIVMAAALEDQATSTRLLADAVADEGLAPARRAGLVRLVQRTFGATSVATAVANPPEQTAKQAPSPATVPKPACPPGMAELPGGKFWVGSRENEHFSADESPRYLTELAPFCLDETEVTVGAFGACVTSGDCKTPEDHHKILCNFGRPEREAHPMNCIEWELASAFCAARGARLPTEVEFEYAARGGDRYLDYPWGKGSPDGQACWKQPMSCPVKTYAAGAFGLFDVSGNVWEWTDDWYGPYPFPPPTGTAKVYRGGSFSRRFDKWMHTRLRERSRPRDAGAHLGFRCAKTLELARCPFGQTAEGGCRHGVLERECPPEKSFNGVRCAKADEPRCPSGTTEKPGHGCISEAPAELEPEDVQAAAETVTSERSPEHDEDCRTNSRDRPHAFRYLGGSHAARNFVSRNAGCKNRDVGVGWNSTCCP